MVCQNYKCEYIIKYSKSNVNSYADLFSGKSPAPEADPTVPLTIKQFRAVSGYFSEFT